MVAGGGPLDCDFSKVDGPILTGVLPRHQRPSLNLQVPRGYLKNPITDGEQGADGTVLMFMNMETFLPERKPLPSEPSDNLNEVERQRNQLMMLVWDAATPSAILENLARSYQVNVRIAEGLSEGFVTMASKHGDKDLSVSISENEIRDVMLCDSQSSVKYPGCQHYFRFNEIDVQLDYRRIHLEDWRTVRQRSERFLQCIISQ